MFFIVSLAIAIAIAVVVVAGAALRRWVTNDGGPRPEPLPRYEDDWSADLPTHPYATGSAG